VRITGLGAALKSDPNIAVRYLARLARYDTDPFTALGTAFLRDGAFIECADGAGLDLPVYLLFLSSGKGSPYVSAPRCLVVAGRNSRLSIVEHYAAVGDPVYWTNAVAEIIAGEGSVVEHDKLQTEGTRAFHIGSTHILLGARASFTSNAISLGGSLVRNNVSAQFDGEEAECTLNGLSLATGKQHVDNHTTIDHARAHCTSHELYASILDGNSRGVFNGKIFVRRDAQKTDAKQTNRTLLLSDGATIDTKPQLEIFADDVKCTHGATVGQLDEDQVFYLRSRGIDHVAARDLLTYAFASNVINRVHVDALRTQLDTMLRTRLHEGRVAGGV
jgi:Fe-S cluster assembly protein SufD